MDDLSRRGCNDGWSLENLRAEPSQICGIRNRKSKDFSVGKEPEPMRYIFNKPF